MAQYIRCLFLGTAIVDIPSPCTSALFNRKIVKLILKGVSEYDQDFEDGATNFTCTREYVIRLYQSELLHVLPDRLTSALQPYGGDRRLKKLFADSTSDSFRTMIQNTIQECTTQYVARLYDDSSSLDASTHRQFTMFCIICTRSNKTSPTRLSRH